MGTTFCHQAERVGHHGGQGIRSLIHRGDLPLEDEIRRRTNHPGLLGNPVEKQAGANDVAGSSSGPGNPERYRLHGRL